MTFRRAALRTDQCWSDVRAVLHLVAGIAAQPVPLFWPPSSHPVPTQRPSRPNKAKRRTKWASGWLPGKKQVQLRTPRVLAFRRCGFFLAAFDFCWQCSSSSRSTGITVPDTALEGKTLESALPQLPSLSLLMARLRTSAADVLQVTCLSFLFVVRPHKSLTPESVIRTGGQSIRNA